VSAADRSLPLPAFAPFTSTYVPLDVAAPFGARALQADVSVPVQVGRVRFSEQVSGTQTERTQPDAFAALEQCAG